MGIKDTLKEKAKKLPVVRSFFEELDEEKILNLQSLARKTPVQLELIYNGNLKDGGFAGYAEGINKKLKHAGLGQSFTNFKALIKSYQSWKVGLIEDLVDVAATIEHKGWDKKDEDARLLAIKAKAVVDMLTHSQELPNNWLDHIENIGRLNEAFRAKIPSLTTPT